MLRGLLFQAWGSLTSLKSQTRDTQVKVPFGGHVLRIFTSWKNSSTSAWFEPANLGSRGEHSPPRPTNNVIVFQFTFHIFMPLVNLWFIHLHGKFPILKEKSCPDLYPFIRLPWRPLTVGSGKILIPRFIRSPPTLAFYDVAHSVPLGGVGRDFPFTKNETQRHLSYLSGSFRENENSIY